MNGKTNHVSFCGHADGTHQLFSVNPGVEKIRAIEQAGLMVGSVCDALTRAIGDGRDIEVEEAALLRDSIMAVAALLEACQ